MKVDFVLLALSFGLLWSLYSWNIRMYLGNTTEEYIKENLGRSTIGCVFAVAYIVGLIFLLFTPYYITTIALLVVAIPFIGTYNKHSKKYKFAVRVAASEVDLVVKEFKPTFTLNRILITLIWSASLIIYLIS